ncbi:hypothetical protein BG004_004933, partial [Podila humilis]
MNLLAQTPEVDHIQQAPQSLAHGSVVLFRGKNRHARTGTAVTSNESAVHIGNSVTPFCLDGEAFPLLTGRLPPQEAHQDREDEQDKFTLWGI